MNNPIKAITPLLDLVTPAAISYGIATWRGRTVQTINPVYAALIAVGGTLLQKIIIIYIAAVLAEIILGEDKPKEKDKSTSGIKEVLNNLYIPPPLQASGVVLGVLFLGIYSVKRGLGFEFITGLCISILYSSITSAYVRPIVHEKLI